MNLLGKKFDSFTRITENDSLRNLELIEKRRQAVKLLLFFKVGIVLCKSFKSQFVRRLDILRFGDVLFLETLDLLRVGGGEKCDLWLGHEGDDGLYDFAEVLGEEFVDFVEDEEFAEVEICDVFVGQVEDPAWRGHNDVHSLAETVEIVANLGAAGADHALNFFVLAEVLDNERSLHGELTSGHQHQSLNLEHTRVDALDQRDRVRCSFASSVLRLCNNVPPCQNRGDRFLLNRRRRLESHLVDPLNSNCEHLPICSQK